MIERARRLVLPLLAVGVVTGGCGAGASNPGWTYGPTLATTSASPTLSESAAPSASPTPSASAGGSGAVTLELKAETFAFDLHALEAKAGEAFAIHLVNNDAGTEHDVDIRKADGTVVVDTATVTGVGEISSTIPALDAGDYVFICSVHPIPGMTGTLTVK